MNKLNNKEKKLWEDCLKETIPSPPSKDESWVLLKKQGKGLRIEEEQSERLIGSRGA